MFPLEKQNQEGMNQTERHEYDLSVYTAAYIALQKIYKYIRERMHAHENKCDIKSEVKITLQQYSEVFHNTHFYCLFSCITSFMLAFF